MVVALGPGRFYGSSLPRPRLILPSVEDDGMGTRVEPVGVLDPLLSWANEAHWSMGGLSFKRLRLQGRIEGNLKKLRSEDHHQHKNSTLHNKKNLDQPSPLPPPPAAPKPKPIRRRLALIDDSDDDDEVIESDQDDEVIIEKGKRKRPMKGRKLEDDFQRVATSDPSETSQDGDLNPSLEKKKKKKMITREGRDKGSSISINDGARRTLRSSSSSSKVFSTPIRTSPRLSSAR